MKFEEFQNNIEQLAKVDGTYEQSTEAQEKAQALKAVGDYLIAETDKNRIDAIGDIAVCIVNIANISNYSLRCYPTTEHNFGCVRPLTIHIIDGGKHQWEAIKELQIIANYYGYNFNVCLGMAWNKIKNREREDLCSKK